MERRDLYADTSQARAWDAPEAFAVDIRPMTPEEVQAAREEALAAQQRDRQRQAALVKRGLAELEAFFGTKKGA